MIFFSSSLYSLVSLDFVSSLKADESAVINIFLSSSSEFKKFLIEGISIKRSNNEILLDMYFRIFPFTLSLAEI